jgi:CRP-like cAMP-binding protein
VRATQFSNSLLLSGLRKAAAADIAKSMRLIELERRAVLFKPGDAAAGIYVVASGMIKLSLPSSRPQAEKVVALLGPGETLGIAALLAQAPHVTLATAARDSTVWRLSKNKALRALSRDPLFARQVGAEVSRRLRNVLVDVHSAATQSGVQRTAAFLAGQLPRGTRARSIELRLPVGKAEIASKLDLTPAHFSRILRQLAAAGVITVRAATVTVDDLSKLRSLATAALPKRHWLKGRP